MAGKGIEGGGGMDFTQSTDLDSLNWDTVLTKFIRQYQISFQRLELLMIFYRHQAGPATAEELTQRTGYQQREVESNLAYLSSHGMLSPHAKGGSKRYGRPEADPAAEATLLRQTIRRLADTFADREGRLKIIFSILKSQEE
jgi:hypothetical protein